MSLGQLSAILRLSSDALWTVAHHMPEVVKHTAGFLRDKSSNIIATPRLDYYSLQTD